MVLKLEKAVAAFLEEPGAKEPLILELELSREGPTSRDLRESQKLLLLHEEFYVARASASSIFLLRLGRRRRVCFELGQEQRPDIPASSMPTSLSGLSRNSSRHIRRSKTGSLSGFFRSLKEEVVPP